MPHQATVYNVMIASPSDVSEARDKVRQTIGRWNSVHSRAQNIVLLPIDWEADSTPETGGHPQDIINRQLLEESDLLIGLFWTRLGTPTDNYVSGSAEEIDRHVHAGKPAMLYFSTQGVNPNELDPDQLMRLREFRARWEAKAVVWEWNDISEFEIQLYGHLERTINNHDYFQRAIISDEGTEHNLSTEAKEILEMMAEKDGKVRIGIDLPGSHRKITVADRLLASEGHRFHRFRLYELALDELSQGGLITDVTDRQSPAAKLLHESIYVMTDEGVRVYSELQLPPGI